MIYLYVIKWLTKFLSKLTQMLFSSQKKLTVYQTISTNRDKHSFLPWIVAGPNRRLLSVAKRQVTKQFTDT